jgi:hypothetical protein
MQKYKIKFTGITSLLMHRDDVDAADRVAAFRKDPANKKGAKGDDRWPIWTWKTYLYDDGEHVVIPSFALMAMLRKGGSDFKIEGKGNKTLKAASQTCIRFTEESFKLHNFKNKLLPIDKVNKITSEVYTDHQSAAGKLGIILDKRRVTIPGGTSKHVRVRPKWCPGWWFEATAVVIDTTLIPKETFCKLVQLCGMYAGLLDWRPGAPKSPGSHGVFEAEITEI